ncbi:MAG: ATP-binding protein [Clostridiales Family XIII bacterium]|nr:ATP-binding protein [Clostridiales Family XIII bacterium]
MIERSEYLNQLVGFKDKNIIKIVTGIRRCGKSTLLEMYQQNLLDQGILPEQIISINFEDYANKELLFPDNLHSYVLDRMPKKGMTYVFLDEIQNVFEFQKVVDSLFLKKNVDLYLTGSNAHMLSGDLATLLSGRYVEIEMLPLSFKEYVNGSGDINELGRKYAAYLETSSFPGAMEFSGNQKQINEYLSGIYNTVLVKDVVERYHITDTLMLESIIRFVFNNVGNQLSTKSISNAMNSSGRKVDVKTVEKYLQALMDSYILYQAKRYNVKGKQYLKTLEKYYAVDIGMRYMLLGRANTDTGHILENVVYLELLRRGFQVYVGKLDELEVDFVCMNQDGITYFQVAATVREAKTLERELKPLKKLADTYPKYILTLDEDPDADYDGIRRINVLDWLLK